METPMFTPQKCWGVFYVACYLHFHPVEVTNEDRVFGLLWCVGGGVRRCGHHSAGTFLGVIDLWWVNDRGLCGNMVAPSQMWCCYQHYITAPLQSVNPLALVPPPPSPLSPIYCHILHLTSMRMKQKGEQKAMDWSDFRRPCVRERVERCTWTRGYGTTR